MSRSDSGASSTDRPCSASHTALRTKPAPIQLSDRSSRATMARSPRHGAWASIRRAISERLRIGLGASAGKGRAFRQTLPKASKPCGALPCDGVRIVDGQRALEALGCLALVALAFEGDAAPGPG